MTKMISTWVGGMDANSRLHQTHAICAGVDHHVGAEAGAHHGHALGPPLYEVGQQLELPVLSYTASFVALPGRRSGQLIRPGETSEEVWEDAGEAELLRDVLAVLLGTAGVWTEDVVTPHQPPRTQRRPIPQHQLSSQLCLTSVPPT